jgi:hypothetical protein
MATVRQDWAAGRATSRFPAESVYQRIDEWPRWDAGVLLHNQWLEGASAVELARLLLTHKQANENMESNGNSH